MRRIYFFVFLVTAIIGMSLLGVSCKKGDGKSDKIEKSLAPSADFQVTGTQTRDAFLSTCLPENASLV